MLTGCGRSGGGGKVQGQAGEARAFHVRGVVREVKTDVPSLVVAHDAIDGYMDAMTMEFRAADANEISDLTTGDKIRFRLNVTKTGGWIEGVELESRPIVPSETMKKAEAPITTLGPGDRLPQCKLIDQAGRSFSPGEWAGNAVAITFIFTRCPFPDFCPRMTQNFREVQEELGTGSGGENWRLISVTIDPAHDSPEKLAEYARKESANLDKWTFATGAPSEIEKLSRGFGLSLVRQGDQLNHNLRTAIVDTSGRVQKVFIGNAWSAKDLAAEMRRAMAAH